MIKLDKIVPLIALVVLAGTGSLFAQASTKKAAEAKAEKATEEKSTEPVVRKSVFEEPLRSPYTDPFFPLTPRVPWRQKPSEAAPTVDPQFVLLDQIILKGISGPVGRRLALINNYTFAAGESGVVRLPKGSAKIEVLEVKERSAVIKVEKDPQPKEIFLRPEP